MPVTCPAPIIRVVPVGQADCEAVAALVNRAFSVYSHLFKGQRASTTNYRDEALCADREFGQFGDHEMLAYRVFHEEDHLAGHRDFVVTHRYCEMVKEL